MEKIVLLGHLEYHLLFGSYLVGHRTSFRPCYTYLNHGGP